MNCASRGCTDIPTRGNYASFVFCHISSFRRSIYVFINEVNRKASEKRAAMKSRGRSLREHILHSLSLGTFFFNLIQLLCGC